jgi:hypothetical protein
MYEKIADKYPREKKGKEKLDFVSFRPFLCAVLCEMKMPQTSG